MLVYIIHSDKIYTYRLPKEVSGSFVLCDYDNNKTKRNLLSITSVDNNWLFKSNDEVKIIDNNTIINEIKVEVYKFYKLKVSKDENILLYVAPGFDNNFICKDVLMNSNLKIGNNSDISYTIPEVFGLDIDLKFNDSSFYLKNNNVKIPVYVNKNHFIEGKLHNFDELFIMGLKIIIVGKTLLINGNKEFIKVNSGNLINEAGSIAVDNIEYDNTIYNNFFNAEDFFSKSPVFKKKINTEELEISSPQPKEERYHNSIFMEIIPSGLMCVTSVLSGFFTLRSYNKGLSDKETLVTALVLCIVMLFISIIWPFIERFVSFAAYNINEARRVKIYRNYLKKKRRKLEEINNNQKSIIEFNNISLDQCLTIVDNKTSLLFSRNIDNDDFLNIRLGTGNVLLNVKINYTKPDVIQDNDKLLDEIDSVLDEFKYINNAPFVFSFNKENSLSIIGSRENTDRYIKTILLQLLVFHDYNNLKLVVLTSDKYNALNSLKNSSYCFDNNNEFRFYSENLIDGESISTYLYREYLNRKKLIESNSLDDINKYKRPYYLIISDNIENYKGLKIVDEIINTNNNLGFGIIMFSENISNIPDGCANFINLEGDSATIFKEEMDENNINQFIPEYLSDSVDFNKYVLKINNIPFKINNEIKKNLPSKYGFLEMFGVGNVKQLNIVNRWNNSNIINSLATPIGIDSSLNTLYLDLHEVKHGPHGLIAGMTGSGKSEFIISYILSMAVNYSPKEVQFVLIDYKGGSLAGAFENRKTGRKLPHLVGTITNLDTSSMNRSLVSIDSELKRRQKLFNDVKENLNTGTLDIYKYQKLYRDGLINESLSHLFIICDEFAELKANQPDFMDKLISIARIGRSLGVHLILSTQKPSGVVDDQIWSNAKFKVCCKVQTTEDSNEMIKKPDAAYLKESGRFYLQVGYDEIFTIGQSAYSGGSYVSSDTIIQNYSKSIEYIDNIGAVYKSNIIDDKIINVNHDGDELKNVLDYIIECAEEIDYKNNNLWLDNIANEIYYSDLIAKYSKTPEKCIINTLVGEYDDPSNQKQGPVYINLTKHGNLFISGITGSGKTTLLQSFIYSTMLYHSEKEVNIYVVDFVSDSLKIFNDAPQIGNILGNGDNDKIIKLFNYLEYEENERKNKISLSDGTYLNMINHGNYDFPNIIVIINGIDVFKDSYDELYNELFIPLSRDGSRFGINFIVTGVSSVSLSSNVEGNFPQKIGLQFTDNSEYNLLFSNVNGLIPNNNSGRGLVKLDKVYEFQVAKINDDDAIDKDIDLLINELKAHYKKIKGIPVMPRIISSDSLIEEEYEISNVPIGIEIKNNCSYHYDFSRYINSIFYSNYNYIEVFLNSLTKLLSKAKNTKVIVLDAMGDLEVYDECKCFNSNFIQVIPALMDNIDEKKKIDDYDENIVFMINGFNKLENHLKQNRLNDINIKTVSDLINYAKDYNNYKFIIVDSINNSKVENYEWFDLFDSSNGILFDIDPDEQEVFIFDDDYNNIKLNKDIAVIINNNKKDYIKYTRR